MSYFLLSAVYTAMFAVLSYHKETPKTLWAIINIIVFVVLGLVNYNTLPVLQWWGFEGVWVEAFFVSLAGIGIYLLYSDGEFTRKNYWRLLPTGITILAFFIAGFQSWEMFHSDEYYKRLKVEMVADTTFQKDVHPIPVSKMISVDAELARKVAEEALEKCQRRKIKDWNNMKSQVRDSLSSYIYDRTKRSPIILPVFLEV